MSGRQGTPRIKRVTPKIGSVVVRTILCEIIFLSIHSQQCQHCNGWPQVLNTRGGGDDNNGAIKISWLTKNQDFTTRRQSICQFQDGSGMSTKLKIFNYLATGENALATTTPSQQSIYVSHFCLYCSGWQILPIPGWPESLYQQVPPSETLYLRSVRIQTNVGGHIQRHRKSVHGSPGQNQKKWRHEQWQL